MKQVTDPNKVSRVNPGQVFQEINNRYVPGRSAEERGVHFQKEPTDSNVVAMSSKENDAGKRQTA